MFLMPLNRALPPIPELMPACLLGGNHPVLHIHLLNTHTTQRNYCILSSKPLENFAWEQWWEG